MKRSARYAVVGAGLICLLVLFVAGTLSGIQGIDAPRAEAEVLLLLAYATLPGSGLLINFLMAFTHAAKMGGESPAIGLPAVFAAPFACLAPYPPWGWLAAGVALLAVDFGVVELAWCLGDWLKDENPPFGG
jgi:hypothetical protein